MCEETYKLTKTATLACVDQTGGPHRHHAPIGEAELPLVAGATEVVWGPYPPLPPPPPEPAPTPPPSTAPTDEAPVILRPQRAV